MSVAEYVTFMVIMGIIPLMLPWLIVGVSDVIDRTARTEDFPPCVLCKACGFSSYHHSGSIALCPECRAECFSEYDRDPFQDLCVDEEIEEEKSDDHCHQTS